jgi:hypothetical protein
MTMTVPAASLTCTTIYERMVLDCGGLLINVSAIAASSTARLRRERGPPRHPTTVVGLPEPFGRRRAEARITVAEQPTAGPS